MELLIEHEGKSASKLLKDLGLFDVPVDLEMLCEKLKINKTSKLKFDDHSGEISVDQNRVVNIWINPIDHSNRQRFTLAHEIGHLVYDIIPYIKTEKGVSSFVDTVESLRRDGRQHPEEYRANDFAAKLLMPEELIMKHGDELIKEMKKSSGEKKVSGVKFISAMASKFQVSEQAMKIRLKTMGVI